MAPSARSFLRRVTDRVPWWGKVATKVLLSRLPVGHHTWKQLGFFPHGSMEKPAYAASVFMRHFTRVRSHLPGRGFVCLELGPGESLFSAMMADACGASQCYLVDVGPYAVTDVESYLEMARSIAQMGLTPSDIKNAESVRDVLAACHASYHTKGFESLREIPTGSVDWVWSHSVLQHVRRARSLSDITKNDRFQGIKSYGPIRDR